MSKPNTAADHFDAILDLLIEREVITAMRKRSIAAPASIGGFVSRLLDEAIAADAIAEVVSKYFDLPLFEDGLNVNAMGADWVICDDKIAYCIYPNGDSQGILLNRRRSSGENRLEFNSFGVISRNKYYDAARNSSDDIKSVELGTSQESSDGETVLKRIMEQSLLRKATDVHIEPSRTEARVSIRIDGQLVAIDIIIPIGASFDVSPYRNLANVLLNMSRGEPGSFRHPQSGQFRWMDQNNEVSVRLEMLPVKVGHSEMPKFVLRILGQELSLNRLDNLGFSDHNLTLYKEVAEKNPHGLVLVTGPTASGKSTTLYAWMTYLNEAYPTRSYYTIEDPVEKEVRGFQQVQVNDDAGLSFFQGLRSLLRADPDVVMVGEIRDIDTAQLALRASMTGHLVMATLHANSAIKAIPRMLEMGLDKILLADSIVSITAQRMVQMVCPNCAATIPFGDHSQYDILSKLQNAPADIEFIKVANKDGCSAPDCIYGFKGRHVVTEIVKVDSHMQELIGHGATSAELLAAAYERGFQEMWEDGIRLVKSGITSIEALERVLEPYEA